MKHPSEILGVLAKELRANKAGLSREQRERFTRDALILLARELHYDDIDGESRWAQERGEDVGDLLRATADAAWSHNWSGSGPLAGLREMRGWLSDHATIRVDPERDAELAERLGRRREQAVRPDNPT
jgi:hypothetical protein